MMLNFTLSETHNLLLHGSFRNTNNFAINLFNNEQTNDFDCRFHLRYFNWFLAIIVVFNFRENRILSQKNEK